MSKSNGHIVWQVRGTDPSLAPHYFDARLIFHVQPKPPVGASGDAMQRWVHERVNQEQTEIHARRLAPFEMTLPDEALTLVVRAHADSAAVDVSFQRFDEAGDAQSKLWTEGGCNVCIIVRSEAGGFLTSLPESSLPSATRSRSG